MAIQSSDYLKDKFSNNKIPNGTDFSDLIDSCINSSVSGGVTFVDSVTAQSLLYCNNIIIQSEDGSKWKIVVLDNGTILGEPLNP